MRYKNTFLGVATSIDKNVSRLTAGNKTVSRLITSINREFVYICSMFSSSDEVLQRMNEAGRKREPFLFGINFEETEGFFTPDPLSQHEVLFDIGGICNVSVPEQGESVALSLPVTSSRFQSSPLPRKVCPAPSPYLFEPLPEEYPTYKKRFRTVMNGLRRGDSYLTNLTIRTPLRSSLSLEEIFHYSNAPYKLYLPGKWVCFSPECFVRVDEDVIRTYPMKGTISARLPHARETILADEKEAAEHNTIVDLLRNDLSRVATDVQVKRFRYLEELQTHKDPLLQVSSEITGSLPEAWRDQLGTLFFELLPAGSVSGAPKEATLRIIREAEQIPRGFYTGVAGYFDGQRLESFVLIRFIEQDGPGLFFRSGGGITARSTCRKEYEEAIQKVYLPFPAL